MNKAFFFQETRVKPYTAYTPWQTHTVVFVTNTHIVQSQTGPVPAVNVDKKRYPLTTPSSETQREDNWIGARSIRQYSLSVLRGLLQEIVMRFGVLWVLWLNVSGWLSWRYQPFSSSESFYISSSMISRGSQCVIANTISCNCWTIIQ